MENRLIYIERSILLKYLKNLDTDLKIILLIKIIM